MAKNGSVPKMENRVKIEFKKGGTRDKSKDASAATSTSNNFLVV